MKHRAIVMTEKDNVATAVEALPSGTQIELQLGKSHTKVAIRGDIGFGHKFAICDIAKGTKVIKYGEPIGVAEKEIKAGEHVHVHNIGSIRGRGDLEHGNSAGHAG
jgi:Altronate dehydratase